MKIRDRIVELRRVPASQLAPNPANWRTHSAEQADALRGLLAEVGFAGAALAREQADGTLQLIDGHLRAETAGDEPIPVLILDVTADEAAKLLATFDPIGAMAGADAEKLAELLAEIETQSPAVQAMLDELKAENAADEVEVGGIAAPELPSGEKSPYQQMTFTLHDDQAEVVKSAIEAAKKAGPFVDTQNENSNGNALARIAEAFIGQG